MTHSIPTPGERSVFRLSYVSRAARSLTPESFDRIVEAAQQNNERLGVTGFLIECAGEFLQVLEGDKNVVQGLFDKIKDDPRHLDVTVIATETAAGRNFGDWSMGCFLLKPEDLPEGFFFEEEGGRRRLRGDAFVRVDDLLETFYRENHDAGMARRFSEVGLSSRRAPALA